MAVAEPTIWLQLPVAPQLEIELHNTYFGFQPLLLTTLMFLPVVTGGNRWAGAD